VTINICATRMIVRLVVHLSWRYFNHLPALMGMFWMFWFWSFWLHPHFCSVC